jgi:hypothetical protein
MYCAYCGAPLEAGGQYCAACGKPTAIAVVTDVAAPEQVRPRRGSWRRRAAVGVLALLALFAVYVYFDARPDFGPEDAAAIEVTLAPGVSAELLPSHMTMGAARFDAFDVSPDGTIVVLIGGKLYEMETGRTVFADASNVTSFAFAGEALMVTTPDGLGYFDDGALKSIGDPIVPNAALRASSDRSRLLLYRATDSSSGEAPALASLEANGAPQILTGSIHPISAAGGDAYRTFFSIGSSLFQMVTPGMPSLVLAMPNEEQPIEGIAVAGTATYFSTAAAVYAVEDVMALPVAIGIGGDIRIVNGAIYVLDATRHRVYRISVGAGGSGS